MIASSSPSPSPPGEASQSRRPFVYISAADAFRPVISSRYLESKREAEIQIMRRCSESPESGIRPLFIRPGGCHTLLNTPVSRPVWSVPLWLHHVFSAPLSLVSRVFYRSIPRPPFFSVLNIWTLYNLTHIGLMYHPHIRPLSTLPAFFLSLSASLADKSGIPNIFASKSALGGAAEALRTHPLHVDHVAEAVVRCLLDEDKEGVINVQTIRQWAGFGIGDAGEKVQLDSSTG